jgi:hypothetical protein
MNGPTWVSRVVANPCAPAQEWDAVRGHTAYIDSPL